MLDIQFIRDNPERVKDGIKAKGFDPYLVDKTVELYDNWTEKIKIYEDIGQKRNILAKESKQPSNEGKELREQHRKAEIEVYDAWKQYTEVALQIPNIPLENVPIGGESKNEIIKPGTRVPQFHFQIKDHVQLGELLDIIDIPRASKISGSRFGYLKNDGVKLEFALVNLAMKVLSDAGFSPIIPPALIKQEITEGLGYWHGGGNENYYLVNDFEVEGPERGRPLPLYLIGTGEHSVVPMHKDEIFEERDLSKKYAAFSPCFRREAGSYGKDVRGILRVHQFDKVEMVAFVKPEDDEIERRKLLSISEQLMTDLGLPYQVVKLASGDLGFPSAETIDIETWIPSQNRYRETHSISTTTDFQSRRLNIKYKKEGAIEFVHILNGTAFAIGRIIVAILENFQQEDGTVIIPEVLQKYTGFSEIVVK